MALLPQIGKPKIIGEMILMVPGLVRWDIESATAMFYGIVQQKGDTWISIETRYVAESNSLHIGLFEGNKPSKPVDLFNAVCEGARKQAKYLDLFGSAYIPVSTVGLATTVTQ